jgi:hypothetical protein
MNSFWINDPLILLNKHRISELWPKKDYNLERKLNAITRLIILLCFLGYFLTKNIKILISTLITLVILVIIYKSQKIKKVKNKEGFTFKNIDKKQFTMPTEKNPMMNVMPTDYIDNPKKKKAAPSYEKSVHAKIMDKGKKIFKNSIPNKKLFQDLGENLAYENSMRNFYTNPSTTIPNNQEAFAKFLYGNMPSCKEGDAMQCTKNNTQNFNVRY